MKIVTRSYRQGARADAAEATGRRIVEAFLARMMTQWFDEITLDLVAADAGVTVQTVVRRFGGKEGLLEQGVEVMAAQINARRAAPPGDLDRLVDNLIADYEKTGDTVIRLLAVESRHPVLTGFLNVGRAYHRNWAETGFASALEPLDDATRRRLVDAIVIASDVYTWKLLRRDMGRSIRATATTMKSMIRACLENAGDQIVAGPRGRAAAA